MSFKRFNRPKPHTDPKTCPICKGPGNYSDERLMDGRGIYNCDKGHIWQDGNETRR